MENTLENKKKFYAQYYGQKVLGYEQKVLDKDTKQMVNEFAFKYPDELKETYLSLTPLSSITDEDAIAVAKMLRYPKDKSDLQLLENVKVDLRSYFNFTNRNVPLKVSDFIRSKGYALPWMGVSVEQQIEYGWINLTPPLNQ